MNTTLPSLAALVLSFSVAHCGAAVSSEARPSTDASTPDAPATDAATGPSCAEVRARCGAAPEQFVRGHAEGLAGLEGARVQFAMRYVREEGGGLNVPHGVVSAWGRVEGGAFEACVCMPHGGNLYPVVAAVVFAPGSAAETSRDVVRATYSQRYATLGDENLAQALQAPVEAPQVEAALAAMVDRATGLTLRGLHGAEAQRLYGALVSDERPVAAEVVGAVVREGAARFEWILPGRQWPSERVVLLHDRNDNHRCDEGDRGAEARVDGRDEVTAGPWVEGAALTPLCQALRFEASRE